MTFESVDPTNGVRFAEYASWDDEALDAVAQKSDAAFERWRTTPVEERTALLDNVAAVLRRDVEPLAALMTREMGKVIGEARAEVQKCAWVCEYYAETAEKFLQADTIVSDGSASLVRYDPLGPILAIMPWNFPLWQVFRFAAPTLSAGNVAILKHSPNVTGCALAIERVFSEAGYPAAVFQTALADLAQTERLLRDPRVRGVSLTGSVRAGRAVGQIAGSEIKPCVLELGGSDPFVVLADADIDEAVAGAVFSRTLNCGQSCIAAKRFVVERPALDEFTAKFVEAMSALVVGDPTDAQSQMGPMAREDLRATLHEQVRRSVAAGAACVLGGAVPQGAGYFYPPTVLTGVRPGMPAYDEELFGPVAAIIEAEDRDDALRIANDTTFGLGASVWTRDPDPELAAHIDAGHVAFNGIVKSDPRLPFGGIKTSGIGRELSRLGILEFVNAKTVWVK